MRVKVDGVHLNYELAGSGQCLTLVHGLAADLTIWKEQVRVFSRSYLVLTVDVRGFGRSDKLPGPYSIRTFSNDLYGLLRALDIHSTIVAGHSMGGRIAMAFGLDHPEMVNGLILVGASAAVSPDMQRIMEQHARLAETQGMEAVIDAIVARIFSPGFARHHPESFARYRQLHLHNDHLAYAAACRANARFDLSAEIGRIACPTLVIVGDHDIPTPLDSARVLNSLIPNSKLTVIKDSGHTPMVEQPEEFHTAVRPFLETISH